MDAYKRLRIEFGNIEKTITDYTSSGAANFLSELKASVENCDKDAILYCLDSMIAWYESHIREIHSNEFVFNSDEHDQVFATLKEVRAGLENYNFIPTNNLPRKNNSPMIFLSHRSTDKKYADAIELFLTGIGVKNNQLIYTSHPLHKIPLDKNIYDYLRENINRNIFMIFLWSDAYLESPACMNEMGAAWVAQCDYTNIYVPDFSFGNPKYHECAVDTRKMGAVLNGDEHCKQSMYELKDKIQELFDLSIEEKEFAYLLDAFIGKIKEE